MGFVGIVKPEEFRTVTRAHVIAYREELLHRQLQGATIRRELAALSSLFEYLCERNAVPVNPVKGVARPKGAHHRIPEAAGHLHLASTPLFRPARNNRFGGRLDTALTAEKLQTTLQLSVERCPLRAALSVHCYPVR